ncbi:glycoside hydrolase family 128 protein [Aaosphaeria arxii CBS 175.79]|uniref:Glycoside hydrolase family 128 protein n=1 Tax=Aaosphaeria arxii CBS 175.79 TaxID=1450172 RepID=A0A6A5X7W8_9PLEO|nr:glycoside hydrolase family 128 protein [Aaosphaeria arxii CBS 175.79]KAF2008907.1 glycoside hydrolase family 128 protein [Aaosphaeria arxii CBS 175.79]
MLSCNINQSRPGWHFAALVALLFSPPAVLAQANRNSKRGIAYLGDTHRADNNLLISSSTPLSWYYNWSPYPNTDQIPRDGPLEFIPLIHGIDGAEDSQTARVIGSLPESSSHILSFNEPDGTKDSGGSSIEPKDAAKAYIEHIVPYRNGENGGRKWKISHPSTTGSPMGLEWLRRFNESCYEIDSENGCPTDFIAAHWYGAFDGLTSWLGTLDEFYNKNASLDLKIWVTEMALPQADEKATVAMMNSSLGYLDGLDYVERYAWFGAFRSSDANEWTGDGVALFDKKGGLTELGALYMGGEQNGFKEGQKGEGEGAASGFRVSGGLVAALAMLTVYVNGFW